MRDRRDDAMLPRDTAVAEACDTLYAGLMEDVGKRVAALAPAGGVRADFYERTGMTDLLARTGE